MDNVSITPGTGDTIAADEVSDGTLGTVKVQYVKIMDGALNGTTKAGVGSNGLKVDGSGVTQPISGSVTITGTVGAAQVGTYVVIPGNTQNTTPWLFSLSPASSGGLNTFHLVSAANTNPSVVKPTAGQVFGWYIYNSSSSARKVAFHNTGSSPTAGSSVMFSLVIPPNSGANVELSNGIAFSSGIALTTVAGLADSDNTAVGANDLIINVFHK